MRGLYHAEDQTKHGYRQKYPSHPLSKQTYARPGHCKTESDGYLHVQKYLCETGDQPYEHQGI